MTQPLELGNWRMGVVKYCVRYPQGRLIPRAPDSFDGTLHELYEQHIVRALPPLEEVAHQHHRLLEHCARPEATFVIRALTSTERGELLVTDSGNRVRPSDNSPAWWMHFVAFNGLRDARFDDMPTRMFELPKMVPNINTAGWHVAHMYSAKDGQTDWRRWTQAQLARRFIRNLHPCNCFYVPKIEWRRYGGEPRVIGFLADCYRERYGAVWSEFVQAAGGEPLFGGDGSFRYVYPLATGAIPLAPDAIVSYRHSRFCFRADIIEPLGNGDEFEIVTPVGRFRMTKAEFYRAFPGVVASKSYRERGLYHYPKLPAIAGRYRVGREPGSGTPRSAFGLQEP